LQTLQKFNRSYSALFDPADDEEGSDIEPGEKADDGFHRRFGWIYQTELVAELERIKLDDVYDLGIVNVLNDLVYLKAKKAHEAEMMKKVMGH